MDTPVTPAVLRGRLRECDRQFPRPGSNPYPPPTTVPWREFCDPNQPWLARCVEEWQQRGDFQHRRGALVLVAFRVGWLLNCASVPEMHLGGVVPQLDEMRAGIGERGQLTTLLPTQEAALGAPEDWWHQLHNAFVPLCTGLHELGGPVPNSHQYWGNLVGLLGAVLWRMHQAGLPGNTLETAHRLRAATGAEQLLQLDGQANPWMRRTTCCQWWRSGANYCVECVLWDSHSRNAAPST